MPYDATEGVAGPNTALGCNHQLICMPQLQPSSSSSAFVLILELEITLNFPNYYNIITLIFWVHSKIVLV